MYESMRIIARTISLPVACLLFWAFWSCTAAQVQQVQDVKGQAKNLCEARLLERLAPILLSDQQARITIEAARYACAAAESECVDEALKIRQEQLELQKAKEATPPAPPQEQTQPEQQPSPVPPVQP